MGYCYDVDGRLCCDVCSSSGGVRKYRCPFGYCPAIAMCPRCRKAHPEYVSKAYHRTRHCEEHALQMRQERQEKERLLDAGHYIRCSALSHNGRVKVLFQNKAGNLRAYWMSHRNYEGRGLMVPTTVADYKSHGRVTRAKSTEIYDAEKDAAAAA